jgi:Flp pilus assembly protein TadG
MGGGKGGITRANQHSAVPGDGRKGGGAARPSRGCPSFSAGRRGTRGAATVWTALIMVVLLGIVGLSLDRGKVAWNLHQLHNAADAGALAGADVVKCYAYDTAAQDNARTRQSAITAASKNYADGQPVAVADNLTNASKGEVVLGRWILPDGYFE